MMSRADLHVHSRHSDRPTEWVLRRIGAPECYTQPKAVYDTARRRGMQFVTISDHNCINGALEIAHLPGTFVSNEITAYFPDDGCKVHVLCWNITEAQFAEIQRLRENIVDLRDYMYAERIAHACAHPLYSVNDRLTIAHFERLLVLFNAFEAMNGGRHRRGNHLVAAIMGSLTRETFERIVGDHGIEPVGDRPWIKGLTGGSDDHSGAFVAKGFTECPASESVAEFLRHVSERRSRPGGLDGTPLSFAHSLYSIGYQYYRDRFFSKGAGGRDPILQMLSEVFGREQTSAGIRDRVSYYARRIAGRTERVAEVEFKQLVSREMVKLFGEDWLKDDFAMSPVRYEELNRRTFELASRIANQLFFQFTRKFVEKLATGSIFGSLQALSAAGPIALGVAPYLFSFAHQSRDRKFLNEIEARYLGTRPAATPKVAWFLDPSDDPAAVPVPEGADVTVISCAERAPEGPMKVQHFVPVGQFTLPELEALTFAFPPFLDVLDYCERQQFSEIVITAPGLAGLTALLAGKLLGIKVTGLYRRDLVDYIRTHTDDEALEQGAARFVRWFYDQMDEVRPAASAASLSSRASLAS